MSIKKPMQEYLMVTKVGMTHLKLRTASCFQSLTPLVRENQRRPFAKPRTTGERSPPPSKFLQRRGQTGANEEQKPTFSRRRPNKNGVGSTPT